MSLKNLMDEKELIKDIRWKISKGTSKSEITRKLQAKGLKLEFIESLFNRAERRKKLAKNFFIIFIVLMSLWMGVYGMFFFNSPEEVVYSPSWNRNTSDLNETSGENYLKITPELISLVAYEIGASNLRRHPMNMRRPILNFYISDKEFNTIVGRKIETSHGIHSKPDIEFVTNKETIEHIFLLDDLKEGVKKAVEEGKIEINQIASEHDLFLKGYLKLYNDIK